MTTLNLRNFSLRNALSDAFEVNRLLTWFAILSTLGIVLSIIGTLVDPRMVLNEPAWVKPMKFFISLSVYSFTLLWMLSFVEGKPKLVRFVAVLTAIAGTIELLGIGIQAGRGVRSHFNYSTPFDSFVYTSMAIFVVALWIGNVGAAILLSIQKFTNPVLGWALRLGLIITAVGAAVAFAMTAPTQAQVAEAATSGEMSMVGAHAVGVEDGGPGLPFVGWSTEAGDIRPSHFVGLHALQVIPFIGLLLINLQAPWLAMRHRVTLIWAAGLGYLGIVLILFWQALRGQSIIAADALTLGALAAVLVVVGATSLITVVSARRSANQGQDVVTV
ncbi:MAG: hypothetical protein GYB68_17540 [Chloroflexi bacterium]|nr:hypothetical protein [Chloroflexota bacterium]